MEKTIQFQWMAPVRIGVLALLWCAAQVPDAQAQSEGAPRRKRERYLEYNKAIEWSASPFDASAHREETEKKDDIPTGESWLNTAEGRALSSKPGMPDTMMDTTLTTLMMEQNRIGQAGPRRARSEEEQPSSLLETDIHSEITGEKTESVESGWGWLADSILSGRSPAAEDLETGQEEEEEPSYRPAAENRRAGGHVTDSLTAGETGFPVDRYASPLLKAPQGTASRLSGSGGAASAADRKAGSGVAATLTTSSTGSDDLMAVWERDMGLADQASRDDSALPQTKKILEDLTRSAIRPQEATLGEAGSARRTLSAPAEDATDGSLFSRRQAAEAGASRSFSSSPGLTPSTFTPYQSSYTRRSSVLEPASGGSFTRSAYAPSYSSSSGFEENSGAGGGVGSAYGQPAFKAQDSSPSSLESFRQMHRSSGSIRPFESGER